MASGLSFSYNISGPNSTDVLTLELSTTTASTTTLISPSDEKLYFIMNCYVNPSVAMVSLILNSLSVLVFAKSGLRKPTNVLLCALSVADIMSHGGPLNFAQILRNFGPGKPFPAIRAWQYRYEISYVLYLCERLCDFFGVWGMYVQTSIPIIITLDRILAVFWPIHCREWITFRTSCVIVLITYALWLPWVLFIQSLYSFYYAESRNLYFGAKIVSDVYYANQNVFYILNTFVFENLSSWIPVALVTVGCVAIGVKLKMTIKKRQLLVTSSHSKPWSFRTTRALVSVCLFFMLSHTVYSALLYVYLDKLLNNSYYINLIAEYFRLVLSINKGCNFVVFVVFNDKFRKCSKNILKL